MRFAQKGKCRRTADQRRVCGEGACHVGVRSSPQPTSCHFGDQPRHSVREQMVLDLAMTVLHRQDDGSVSDHRRVAGKQTHGLRHRLREQDAIERISMNIGQSFNGSGMTP